MDDKIAADLFRTLSRRHGEDIAQEAIARTLAALAGGVVIENVEHYAGRAAKRLVIESYRQKSTRPEVVVDALPEPACRATQHVRVEARQEIERVSPALVIKATTGAALTSTERSRRFRLKQVADASVLLATMATTQPEMIEPWRALICPSEGGTAAR